MFWLAMYLQELALDPGLVEGVSCEITTRQSYLTTRQSYPNKTVIHIRIRQSYLQELALDRGLMEGVVVVLLLHLRTQEVHVSASLSSCFYIPLIRARSGAEAHDLPNLRKTTLHNYAVVPRQARIQGS